MKKFAAVFLAIGMCLAMVACGNSTPESSSSGNNSPNEKVYLEESEVTSMHANPKSFEGKYVKLSGRVFGPVEQNSGSIAFQMWCDPVGYDLDVAVIYNNNDVSIKENDYVIIDGMILGEMSGQNAFGGTITSPMIAADTLVLSSYAEVVSPTQKTITPENATIDQHGCVVTIEKIELAENETRVYIKATNNSSEKMSVYTFNMKLVQGNKQYEESYQFGADYPELPSSILPGIEADGVVVFDPISPDEAIKVYVEAGNDNYRLDFEDYVFEIPVQ